MNMYGKHSTENQTAEDRHIMTNYFAYMTESLNGHRNRCLENYYKKCDKENPIDFEDNESDFGVDIPFDDALPLHQQVLNSQLSSALRQLNKTELKILILKTSDKRFNDIAEIVNINENTVKTIYYTMINKLRAKMKGDIDNERNNTKGKSW